MFKFYDTCSLLAREDLDENIVISSITLQELEEIKNSRNKDVDVKSAARQVLRTLTDRKGEYEICIFKESMLEPILDKGFTYVNNDLRILATAVWFDTIHPDEVVFVTNDLALQQIANCFFGEDSIESVEPVEEEYTGYAEVTVHDDETLAHIYEHLNENNFDLLVNQYLLLKDQEGNAIDILKWNGEKLVNVPFKEFKSDWFGRIKPKDAYQQMFFDSLSTNQMTLVNSPAGTGKTHCSLAFLMQELEKHRIDKIIVFCNTVATKDAARLGFYSGSRTEKLLDSQIGNLLSSKLGGMDGVERLIEDNKLLLLPLSDIRGFDTSGMRAGIYLSEAQNMTIPLMKLAIQRVGEDSILVIDGDFKAQVDCSEYEGSNNGMKRVLQVFKGQPFFGSIELKNIYRSKIAKIAEQM